MKGLGKMFVGGLLGAIFGFLISPKRAQKVRDALFGGRPGIGMEPPVRVAIPPAFRTVPSYSETDTASPPLSEVPPVSLVVEPETAESGTTVEAESAMTPLASAGPPAVALTEPPAVAPAEPPAVEPEPPAWEATSSFTPGRTIEANVLAALMGPSLTLVPPAVEVSADEEAVLVEEETEVFEADPAPVVPLQVEWTGPASEAEPEVTPAPEVLEQAAAGTGWPDSESDILSADSVLEDLEPERAGVFEPEPATAPETTPEVEPELDVETMQVAEPESLPTPRTEAADLRARIEDTRERIRRELELSFAARSQQGVVSEPESAPEPTGEGEPPAAAAPAAAPPEADGVPRTADGSFDQEGMRRRIEETRNRLKAKAFDAMMSGEASMLSRDSGSGPRASTAPLAPLDSEVAESIEKTLTEEEF